MPESATLERPWRRYFALNFAKFLRTTFFYRTPPVATSASKVGKMCYQKVEQEDIAKKSKTYVCIEATSKGVLWQRCSKKFHKFHRKTPVSLIKLQAFRNTFSTLVCVKWDSRYRSIIFLVTTFTQQMPESSDSVYSYILMLENIIWYHHFTSIGPNSQEIVNLYQFSLGPEGLIIGTKFTISCEFSPLKVKRWYHMFSSMKKEKYKESELSGIFWVKMVTKKLEDERFSCRKVAYED